MVLTNITEEMAAGATFAFLLKEKDLLNIEKKIELS